MLLLSVIENYHLIVEIGLIYVIVVVTESSPAVIEKLV